MDAEPDPKDTIKNYLRMHEVKSYYKGLENVITTMLTYPRVNYRYLLEPSGHYAHLWNLLNFNSANTWPMQQLGMKDAKTALEEGPGASFAKIQAWIATRADHRQTLKDFIHELTQ